MCVCACVIHCMCVHIYVCVCVLRVCVCSVCCMHVCLCVFMCSVCASVYMHMCVCACMHLSVCTRAWVHTPWHMYKVQRTAVGSRFPFHLGSGCQARPASAFSHWLISLVCFVLFFCQGRFMNFIQTLHSLQPYSLSFPGLQIFFSVLWSFFTNYNTWTFVL